MEIKFLFVLIAAFVPTYSHLNLEWGPCSKTCGGGKRITNVPCSSPGCHILACNTKPCPSRPKKPTTYYSQCSQSCGGGTRIKFAPCSKNKNKKCKTYEDCNTFQCPPRISCPLNQDFRYESRSSCCVKSKGTCGISNPPMATRLRLINGDYSVVGEWPWMAALLYQKSRQLICSGSLIHKDWVLTAAHCIHNREEKYFIIMLGSTAIKFPISTRQYSAIKKFIPHEDYSDPQHDIGLIKLKRSVKFGNYIKPICLPSGESVTKDVTCVASGWGIARKEDIKGVITSDFLLHSSLRNLPKEACLFGLSPSFRLKYYHEKKQLCFGILSGNRGICKGDSGGPLMCQRCSSCAWYAAGVASYGPRKCGEGGMPSVFTCVKYYESWIRKNVKGLSNETFSC